MAADGAERGNPESASSVGIGAFVGMQIRERRRLLGMTITQLAEASRVSVSNVSKIEIGQVSPSLQTLRMIAQALSTPVHELFRGFDADGKLIHVRGGGGLRVTRPRGKDGMSCEMLINSAGQAGPLEPYIVTLEESLVPQTANISHLGQQFLYMLEGGMTYRYGNREIVVEAGDSLTFDGRTPHGPLRLSGARARYLCVLTHETDSDGD